MGNQRSPVQVAGLAGVVAVAGAENHSVALKSDGTVWVWGLYDSLLLGGALQAPGTPSQVGGLSGIVAVAAGGSHGLAVRSDGTVWAWGSNGNGELGDGTMANRNPAVQVSGLSGVVAVAAGSAHSLALKSDGSVWAWGNNAFGQLGDASLTLRSTAVSVSGGGGMVAVAAGASFSLASKADGSGWSWGDNRAGQLGDGTVVSRNAPAPVDGVSNIAALAGGLNHGVAMRADGTVVTWGENSAGQLGNGTTASAWSPISVAPFGSPDLVLEKSHSGEFAAGLPGTYTLTVKNVGKSATSGEIIVSDTVPAGLNNPVASGAGWTCYTSGPVVTCTSSMALQPGAASSISLRVDVTTGAVPRVTNVATVFNLSEQNLANNSAADAAEVSAGGCAYGVTPASAAFAVSGGNASFAVQTGGGCAWSVTGLPAWISASASAGTGPGNVTLTTRANTGTARSASVTIAGVVVTVQQPGAPSADLSSAGSLPHVASGGGWKTTFAITNTGSSVAAIRMNYWADNGKPLILPMSFPQAAAGGTVEAATLERSIEAGATLFVESEASATGAVRTGWGELFSTGPVTGMAVFRQRAEGGAEQEAAVPLESRTGRRYFLLYDNSAGYLTGMAVANHTADFLILGVFLRDETGRQVGFEALTLRPKGHEAFDLNSRWPALAGLRGSLEIDCPRTEAISVIGLRFHPQGPFTTLPVKVE
jgi:uncharacterized repeat protein (TIGR01451 family)